MQTSGVSEETRLMVAGEIALLLVAQKDRASDF